MDKLKPCECGGKATIFKEKKTLRNGKVIQTPYTTVKCTKCTLRTWPCFIYSDAVDSWNEQREVFTQEWLDETRRKGREANQRADFNSKEWKDGLYAAWRLHEIVG